MRHLRFVAAGAFVVGVAVVFVSRGSWMGPDVVSSSSSSNPSLVRLDPRARPRVNFRVLGDEAIFAQGVECSTGTGLLSAAAWIDGERRAWPQKLAFEDFNGDGLADLLLFGDEGGHATLTVKTRRADGRFCSGLTFDLGSGEIVEGVVADVTQDGRADIVVAFTEAPLLALLLGDGRGGVADRREVMLEEPAQAIAVGDITGDGRMDIVLAFAAPTRVILLVGRGDGRFERAGLLPLWEVADPIALRIADLDRDGHGDLVLAHRQGVVWAHGTTTGFLTPTSLSVDSEPTDLVLEDFDLDGRADIALSDRTGNVQLFLGTARGGFSKRGKWFVGGSTSALAAGHFDADGYRDVAVVLAHRNRIVLLMGDQGGGFGEAFDMETSDPVAAILAARVNRDALDDLLIAERRQGGWLIAVTEASRIVVTTTADTIREDGRVSLREAILAANGMPPNRDVVGQSKAPEVIAFNIPESERRDGVFTIEVDGVLGPLPRLADGGTTIDGTTQPGWRGAPIIVLNGRRAGLADGLVITSSLNVIAGLVINGFEGNGVKIIVDPPESGAATGNIVRGCYIGTDPTGRRSIGNGLYGVLITRNRTQANLIGGTAPTDRNVISGNRSNGIELDFPTFGNLILGNYIGTTADGLSALPNGGAGIFISGARDNVIGGREPGAGNLISGNSGSGVQIVGVFGNQVQGNWIGVDATGRRALPNGGDGVTLIGGAHSNLIGGSAEVARNVISGNAQNGVRMADAFSNQIAGNVIGLDPTLARVIPNGGSGILVTAGARENLIGGLEPSSGNIIAGNSGDGITLARGANSNQIVGNFIGTTDREGRSRLPNGGHGIAILGAQNTAIGGTTLAAANTIAYNARAGIMIVDGEEAPSRGNRIGCNAFFANGGLGIDLGGDGVTPNDVGDADDGPNALVNFPVIRELWEVSAGVLLRGRIDTVNPAAARIDVYVADPDPTGFGEGKRCLVQGITPNPDGTFEILLAGISIRDPVTLTTTDEAGNTSEFSRLAPPADVTPPSVRVISPNGGEFVLAGTLLPIAWESSDNVGIFLHEIALSLDSGRTCSILLGRVGGDKRSFVWEVPEGLLSSTARVCVTARDFFDNAATDVSDGDFQIGRSDREEPVVRVIRPNGGEVARAGEPFEITWEASDNVSVANCDLSVSTDGGANFTPLAARIPADVRSFTWNIPEGLSTTRGRVLVRCRDLAGNIGEDRSDGDFAVDGAPPDIGSVVVFDVGTPGRFFVAGRPLTIAWQASDDVGIARHRIEFSFDDGRTFEPLRDAQGNIVGDNIPGDARQFTWAVPRTVFTRTGRFRVTAIDRAGRSSSALSERISIIN
ncbi:MAG: FG-GAP-like repeat-containing protein [Blastocatellia bacterium]|nr:FG-GAP-like repeat-containing protein [Blastocatellia bacterium]MDW8256262.1 FG-GAP-like repeat-containing protein [Acidobacteriota bacterium]